MATNTSEQTLDINKQMQDLIKAVQKINIDLAENTAEILNEGADIIVGEQKRIISGKSAKLASLINKGKVRVTRKNNAIISMGYSSEALKEGFEGVVIEFGRPGVKRKGIDKLGRKIGKMEAVPHIRKGFDLKKEEATQIAVNKLDEILKEWDK